MLISYTMNVIVTSKKAILDIWNNTDIRNTFSDIKNYIFTSTNWIVDIKNRHFN